MGITFTDKSGGTRAAVFAFFLAAFLSAALGSVEVAFFFLFCAAMAYAMWD